MKVFFDAGLWRPEQPFLSVLRAKDAAVFGPAVSRHVCPLGTTFSPPPRARVCEDPRAIRGRRRTTVRSSDGVVLLAGGVQIVEHRARLT